MRPYSVFTKKAVEFNFYLYITFRNYPSSSQRNFGQCGVGIKAINKHYKRQLKQNSANVNTVSMLVFCSKHHEECYKSLIYNLFEILRHLCENVKIRLFTLKH